MSHYEKRREPLRLNHNCCTNCCTTILGDIDYQDQELRERCPRFAPHSLYPDGLTEEQRMEVSEREEEIRQCIDPVFEEFTNLKSKVSYKVWTSSHGVVIRS